MKQCNCDWATGECQGPLECQEIESLRAKLASARLAAQSAAPVGELTVEAWHGDRKVTVYKDVVLRIWGTDIDLDMSHEARSLETVQAAFDWLYAAPAPIAPQATDEWTPEKIHAWARNWHWNDCAEDKPVDPSIYFRDGRLLRAFFAALSVKPGERP